MTEGRDSEKAQVPAVQEGEVLVCTLENLVLKVYQEALEMMSYSAVSKGPRH